MVHLDIASDFSTVAFLRLLRRFFGRRGVPRTITSDNAPTFTMSETILKDCVQALEQYAGLSRELSNREIEWRHITPYAPWQGTVYERLIQSVKHSLYKTVGHAVLSSDELSTVLIENEALLNTRPLLYIDSNSVNEAILRPIDFQQNELEVNYPFDFNPELEGDPTYYYYYLYPTYPTYTSRRTSFSSHEDASSAGSPKFLSIYREILEYLAKPVSDIVEGETSDRGG
ncbi:hypothetical protein ANCCAN_05761 [Ancylostoma caninum]|uniref:Integrase catalytic domain-containing protein n=1 Tax=Ancylostoma caninum TaxID=29170 RepID=A0A368GYX4_ANCCA|nr:hypothetical protein ANCCAN_05761 [Ancylostoma caninum]